MTRKFKSSLGSKIFDVFNYLFILVLVATFMYPFLYMFSISTSHPVEVGTNMVKFLPVKFNLNIYKYLFEYNPHIFRAYGNSITYTAVYTIFVLFLCSMGGFALALKELAFRKFFGMVFFIMMFFGGGLIPTFLWIRSMGMLNTMWAIVLPGAVAPFTIFIFRVYIRTNIHQDLMDSVYVDGGSDLVVYFRIILPLIKPMLATLGLFAAVGMWNQYISALIYLSDRSKYPLTLFLREVVVLGDFGGNSRGRPQITESELSIFELEGRMDPAREMYQLGYMKAVKMAFTMVTVLPILFVYPFAQRYFVKGIMIGSLKG